MLQEFDEEAQADAETRSLNSTADQYLTDAQKTTKYTTKLKLGPILLGQKVGVQHRFATDVCRKMGPGYAAQLRAHLRLVEHARLLAPDEIGSLNKGEVQEAMAAVAGSITQFPTAVLCALWLLQAQEHTSMVVAECRPEKIIEYVDFSRPYCLAKDRAAEMQQLHPQLHQLDLTEREKLEYFCSSITNQLFTPLVQQGANGKSKLKALCEVLRGQWEEHLQEDIPDTCVSQIADLKQFAVAIGVRSPSFCWRTP